MKNKTRRDFIKDLGLSIGVVTLPSFSTSFFSMANKEQELEVHIFSKHLQFLDYKNTGAIAAEMGFSGVDLTVRPGGHVDPHSVKIDLPRAVKEIRESGIDCKMITTSVESVDNFLDINVLKSASNEDIEFYRTNWYRYKEDLSMTKSIDYYNNQLFKLDLLNRQLGLIGCYQNHSGLSIGASFWEIFHLMENIDTESFGVQYDIRHAIVEGGQSWINGLKLLQNQIQTVSLQDFNWGKVNGQWRPVNVPIGEGMVNFNQYFKLLKQYNLKPPASLHIEYSLGGAEKGERSLTIDKNNVFEAMKKDLSTVQKLWKDA